MNNKELEKLQLQITDTLNNTNTTLSNIKDLMYYLPPDTTLNNEFNLTSSTISYASSKLKTITSDNVYIFYLCAQQIGMMTYDLLEACRKKINNFS